MAVLESIRSRIGILVSIVIGISLLAFILTDFLGQGKSIFASRESEIAQIGGKSISYKDFESRVKYMTDVFKFQTQQQNPSEKDVQKINEQTWNQLVDETIMDDEYNDLDLQITSKELLDIMAAPHPLIRYLFTNPETKIFDKAAFYSFGKSINTEKDPGKKAYWLFVENQIRREQYQAKFSSLIKNGINFTSKQAAAMVKDNSKKVNFNFVSVKLNTVSDSMISVKESDLEQFYKKHSYEFEQKEASRIIEYISYNILPSSLDFQQAKKWIDEKKSEFEVSTEIKQFVSLNSDTSFIDKYLKESELSDTLKRYLFSAKIGASYGPYFENSAYKIARVADIKNLPDSIRVSDILVRPKANTEDAVKQAESLADSLKNLLKKGSKFSTLAKMYSDDKTSSIKGGDLGWIKPDSLGKIFNDCFFGKKGDVSIIKGANGTFIVTEIADKGKEVKKLQIGILVRNVEPSSTTIQNIYQTASQFLGNYNTGDKFDLGLKKQGMNPVNITLNTEMKLVPGLENSRELIRWAFSSEVNSLTDIKQYGNKFVIAHLIQIKEKGILPLSQVRDQVIVSVKKQKKVKYILDKVKKEATGINNIEELAGKLKSNVNSANDITFNSYIVPEAGYEPALVAAAVTYSPNKLSEPIEGNNAVYVINVTSVGESDQTNLQMIKSRLNSIYESKANYAFPILMKLADIKDKRIKFL